MHSLLQSYKDSERNKLIKSVVWDLQEDVIIAGIRAMGILERQVTTPLMQMLDSSLHVVDTSSYYTRTHEKIKQFMVDPTEILHGQTVLFEDFPPVKDKLWDTLFKPVSEDIEDLTRQALVIICHSLSLCIHQQLVDHLPGGKLHNASDKIRSETKTCPKHNLAPEYVFSYLDRKKREMPNANTITIEGIVLWSLNSTLSYLDSLGNGTSEKLIKKAMSNRKEALLKYRERRQEIKKQTAQKLRDQEQKKKDKEVKQMEDIQKYTAEATQYKLCTKVEHITELIDLVQEAYITTSQTNVQNKVQEAVKTQIRYYKSVTISKKLDCKLFHMTHDKKALTTEQLVSNLAKILQYFANPTDEDCANEPGPSVTDTEKDARRDELKRKFTFTGTSPTKRKKKNPFPGDDMVGKRISVKFMTSGGKRHRFYKGYVLRKSTNTDLHEYLEDDDQQYMGKMDFYTIRFDPPEDDPLCCFPLEKEWNEDCLNLI